jgi:hypothetical protein
MENIGTNKFAISILNEIINIVYYDIKINGMLNYKIISSNKKN